MGMLYTAMTGSVQLDRMSQIFLCLNGLAERRDASKAGPIFSRHRRMTEVGDDFSVDADNGALKTHLGSRPGLLHFNGEKLWRKIRDLVARLPLGQHDTPGRARV